jgi:cytochrome c oxidase subunit 3
VADIRVVYRQAPAPQFDDVVQQREAASLGMWVFIVTEVMLFGGLFTAYTVFRWLHRPAFVEGSHHMAVVVGAVNTAVLIASSFTMAQAVQRAQRGLRRGLLGFLASTALLGVVFLGLKAHEYRSHYLEGLVPGPRWIYAGPDSGPLQSFFFLYFAMTGLHAVHLTVGVGLVTGLIVLARRRRFTAMYHTPVEVIGLYWHLIDVIWVFLFPLFYLIG